MGYRVAYLVRAVRTYLDGGFDLPAAEKAVRSLKRRGMSAWVETTDGDFVPIKGVSRRPGFIPKTPSDRKAKAEETVNKWYKKPWRQRLPGGLAVDKRPSDFNKKSLIEGTIVELEHTDDAEVAMEIAMDHLVEDPQYYVKLATIEKHANVGSLKRELSR